MKLNYCRTIKQFKQQKKIDNENINTPLDKQHITKTKNYFPKNNITFTKFDIFEKIKSKNKGKQNKLQNADNQKNNIPKKLPQ